MTRSLALGAAFALFALTSPASADPCLDRFVALLLGGNDSGPVKIHVTQEIKGGATSTNWSYFVAPDNWMTEMIEPSGQPLVLAHKNVLYTSADAGKTWTKVRELDDPALARPALIEDSKTARNAVCGEEDLDGIVREVVEADYDSLGSFKTENHFKYWIDRETGFVVKSTYAMKGEGFESFTTQLPEKAPDLTLPMHQVYWRNP